MTVKKARLAELNLGWDKVDVILSGRTMPGANRAQVAEDLAKATGITPENALNLLCSGEPRIVKSGVSKAMGAAYVRKFAEIRVEATLQASPSEKTGQAAPETGEGGSFEVLLNGSILPGAKPQKAASTLAQMAGLQPDQARKLLSLGKKMVVKRGLDMAAARTLVDKLSASGISAELRHAIQEKQEKKAAGPQARFEQSENFFMGEGALDRELDARAEAKAQVKKQASFFMEDDETTSSSASETAPPAPPEQKKQPSSVIVTLSGSLLPEADPEKAVAALAQMAGLAPEKARAILSSGKVLVVKRGIDWVAGQALVEKLIASGIGAAWREAEEAKPQDPPGPALSAEHAEPEEAGAQEEAPVGENEKAEGKGKKKFCLFNWLRGKKSGRESAKKSAGEALEQERAQEAARTQQAEHDMAFASVEGAWRPTPFEVSLMRAPQWLLDALGMVKGQAVAWLGFALILSVITIVLTRCYFSPAVVAFIPFFGGCAALLGQRQNAGESLGLREVLAAFSGRSFNMVCAKLFALGGLALIYALAATALLALALSPLLGLEALKNIPKLGLVQVIAGHNAAFLVGTLLSFVLATPIMLLLIFAPTLVALAGKSPTQALGLSAWAVLTNKKPVLFHALMMVVVFLFACVLAGIGMAISGDFATLLAALFMLAGLTPFWALYLLTGQAATYDVFYE